VNAREIAIKDGDTIGWQCTKCLSLYQLRLFDDALVRAKGCCGPNPCESCSAPTEPHWLLCRACLDKKEAAKERARFEKAEKVPLAEYTGQYVYIDGLGDEGFISVDEIEEVLDEVDSAARPTWGWACDPQTVSLSLTDAIDSALEEMHESAREFVDEAIVEEAQKLVDKALEGAVSYFCDNTTAVLLPKPESPKEETP
jgi:hypothetical protein